MVASTCNSVVSFGDRVEFTGQSINKFPSLVSNQNMRATKSTHYL